MSVTASPVSPQESSTSHAAIPEAVITGFEERWAAWQARGAAHDRTVRRRMMFPQYMTDLQLREAIHALRGIP
jgi:hypothetical protein